MSAFLGAALLLLAGSAAADDRPAKEQAYLGGLPGPQLQQQEPFFRSLKACPAGGLAPGEARPCIEAGKYRVPVGQGLVRGSFTWGLTEEPAEAWARFQAAAAGPQRRDRNPDIAIAGARLRDGLARIDPARVFSVRAPIPLEPAAARGDGDPTVRAHQIMLNALGAELEVDGVNGRLTRAAARRLQREARRSGVRLAVDGTIGHDTGPYLIARYQRKAGLPPTGVIDQPTADKLGQAQDLPAVALARLRPAPVQARKTRDVADLPAGPGMSFKPGDLPAIPDEERVYPRPGGWRAASNVFSRLGLHLGEGLDSLFNGFGLFDKKNAYPMPLNEEGGFEDKYGYKVILARKGERYAGRWGQYDVIRKIMLTAQKMKESGSREPLLIGDIGPQYDRKGLPGHSTHGTRRSVDLYFYRLGDGAPPAYRGRFDPVRNLQLVIILLRDMRAREVLVDRSLKAVLLQQAKASKVDDKTYALLEGKIRHVRGHGEHFHAAM